MKPNNKEHLVIRDKSGRIKDDKQASRITSRLKEMCQVAKHTENLKYNQIWLDSLVDKRRKYRKLLETLMEIQAASKTANKGDRDYVRYQLINEKIRHHHENVS